MGSGSGYKTCIGPYSFDRLVIGSGIGGGSGLQLSKQKNSALFASYKRPERAQDYTLLIAKFKQLMHRTFPFYLPTIKIGTRGDVWIQDLFFF